ncbi:MAG TPA: hypothetical protein VFX16_34750 [Pseudonocardiaceae bacterium]|nr:hypothetical protein [Pseudonocardiaceae bacterium]
MQVVRGPVAWLAAADDPPTDVTPTTSDQRDPARVSLTPEVLLRVTRLQQLVIESTTDHRPVGAHWKAVDFV